MPSSLAFNLIDATAVLKPQSFKKIRRELPPFTLLGQAVENVVVVLFNPWR